MGQSGFHPVHDAEIRYSSRILIYGAIYPNLSPLGDFLGHIPAPHIYQQGPSLRVSTSPTVFLCRSL